MDDTNDPIALPTAGLVVDVRDGQVQIMLLNTHDDAYGDHWLVWSAPADEAQKVAEAISTQAVRAREEVSRGCNAHHGHGADMAWSVRDLDDEARGLRQEADEIWEAL